MTTTRPPRTLTLTLAPTRTRADRVYLALLCLAISFALVVFGVGIDALWLGY